MSIEAVNRHERLYMAADGEIYPIMKFLDADGEFTDDPDLAVTCSAGRGDTWFCLDLRAFEPVLIQ